MISLIVCSIDDFWFEKFSKSLKETIGIEFQLIKIDNKKEKLSIAKAYNKGASEAKYDILIFVHEDVVFHGKNWGNSLVNEFETLISPGVLGVAGSSYLPISPCDWWLSDSKYLHANYLSNRKNGAEGEGKVNELGSQISHPVFALDGVFLAMKKSVWNEFLFDEELRGFHGYDTSICYRISQKYQNYFIPVVLIEHFSGGVPNHLWIVNTIMANKAISNSRNSLLKKQSINKKLEIKVFHLFLKKLEKFSTSWFFSLKYSWIYLLKITNCFFSSQLIYLWVGFQGLFILKSLKK